MMKAIISNVLLFWVVMSWTDCSRPVTPTGSSSAGGAASVSAPSPPCIVYKTKADYFKNIPVILSEDKARIVSYPDVKDVYYKGEFAYPTALKDGFLLDNRGIDQNVAFLSLTYEEFSKMEKTPAAGELYDLIVDKDPLEVMYKCGNRIDYRDIKNELNEIISDGRLGSFAKLK